MAEVGSFAQIYGSLALDGINKVTQKIWMVIGNCGDGTNFVEIIKTQRVLDLVNRLANEGDERYASGEGLQVRKLKFPDEFAMDAWVSDNFYGYSDEDILDNEPV